MSIYTIIGLAVVFSIVILGAATILAYLSSGDKHELNSDNYGAALSLIIIIIIIYFSALLVTFKENPEKFGYVKIETETIEVQEFSEHPNSEVVIHE